MTVDPKLLKKAIQIIHYRRAVKNETLAEAIAWASVITAIPWKYIQDIMKCPAPEIKKAVQEIKDLDLEEFEKESK